MHRFAVQAQRLEINYFCVEERMDLLVFQKHLAAVDGLSACILVLTEQIYLV
jgi:hypothetical protein